MEKMFIKTFQIYLNRLRKLTVKEWRKFDLYVL